MAAVAPRGYKPGPGAPGGRVNPLADFGTGPSPAALNASAQDAAINTTAMNTPQSTPGAAPASAGATPQTTPSGSFLGHSLQDWQNLAKQGQNPYGPTQAPNYVDAFQSAMAATRGNIQSQLTGALADIQNSQAQAQKALGQYAPMINGDYQEGMGGAAKAGSAVDSAIKAAGIHTLMPASAYVAPDRAAVANTRTQDLADQSLLATGAAQQGEHERALANLAAQQNQGAVDQAQMGFDQSMAGAQMGNQNALQMAQLNEQFGNQNALRDLMYQEQLQKQNPNALPPGTSTNPATGPYAASGLTSAQVALAQQSPAYTKWQSTLNDLNKGGYNANQLDLGAIRDAIAKLPPNVQTILNIENPKAFAALNSAK